MVLVFVVDFGFVGEFFFEEFVEDCGVDFFGKVKGCGV